MTYMRVTQSMVMERSLGSMQAGLSRLAKVQEQLATGRVLNRPSDSPSDVATAMRLRSALANQNQYVRNAEDGLGWLSQLDSGLSTVMSQLQRGRDLATQGANTGVSNPASREALAVELRQLRASLIANANTSYLDRPVFGGASAATTAYNPDGTLTAPGSEAPVLRVIGDNIRVPVNMNAVDVFGPDGANVFDVLESLANNILANDSDAIRQGLNDLRSAMDRVTTAHSQIGGVQSRVERQLSLTRELQITLTNNLSEVENTDLARATVDLQLAEVAYQASLASVARTLQPSLLDYLR